MFYLWQKRFEIDFGKIYFGVVGSLLPDVLAGTFYLLPEKGVLKKFFYWPEKIHRFFHHEIVKYNFSLVPGIIIQILIIAIFLHFGL